MKIIPIYKNEIISLPSEIVSEKLSTATPDELRVLLAVMINREFDVTELAAKLDITENAVRRAVEAWKSYGAIKVEGEKDAQKPAKEAVNASQARAGRAVANSTLPHYTSEEIASVVEKNAGCSALLDSCQQTLGKIFNAAEASIIIGLVDHLSLPHDYILLLCSHAANIQKKSVRYVEKMAISFFDRDIITYSALEDELNAIEQRASFEYYIRELFGIGKRALIKKERDFLSNWSDKYQFSRELIQAAYEVTVAKTKEPSLNYANAVLENWYAAGFKTVAEVEAAEEERAKTKDVPSGTSFSTDSFFEAALKRSYGDGDSE